MPPAENIDDPLEALSTTIRLVQKDGASTAVPGAENEADDQADTARPVAAEFGAELATGGHWLSHEDDSWTLRPTDPSQDAHGIMS